MRGRLLARKLFHTLSCFRVCKCVRSTTSCLHLFRRFYTKICKWKPIQIKPLVHIVKDSQRYFTRVKITTFNLYYEWILTCGLTLKCCTFTVVNISGNFNNHIVRLLKSPELAHYRNTLNINICVMYSCILYMYIDILTIAYQCPYHTANALLPEVLYCQFIVPSIHNTRKSSLNLITIFIL